MPLTTQTARHGEMTVPMTDSNPPLISRLEDRVRCGQGTSVTASRCAIVSPPPDGRTEEKCVVSPLELEPSAPTSSPASTVSRFMDRLGANAPSLSSLRTIPSWRSSLLPDTNKTHGKIRTRYSSEGSDFPNPPHSRGARPHHPSLSSLQHRYLSHRHQNKHLTNQNGGHDLLHTSVPLSNRFSHSRTRRHDDPSSSSSSSLSTRPSSSSDSNVPSPSTSEESYPSPYSADALAVFHAPTNKRGANLFKSRRKHEAILEDQVKIIFEEATDTTSTMAAVSSAHSLARRRGHISRLKRRIRALAESMSPPRSKAPTMFNNEPRSPYVDDHDSMEYDIPCLAYISCIW